MCSLQLYDGSFGHSVSLCGVDEGNDSIVYFDPWPGRSLFCEENNAKGVKAVPAVNNEEKLWRITREEFKRILVAAIIETRPLLGTVFGEDICWLKEFRESDFASWFHLHEVGETLGIQGKIVHFKTGGFTDWVDLDVFMELPFRINELRLWIHQAFLCGSERHFAADLAKSFVLLAERLAEEENFQQLIFATLMNVLTQGKTLHLDFERTRLDLQVVSRRDAEWVEMRIVPSC